MTGRVFRAASLVIFGVVLLVCVAGTARVVMLSPPSGTGSISGVTLNLANGYVVIPRYFLDCTHQPPGSDYETCSVDLNGDTLTVQATHGTMNRFSLSDCRATFRGEQRFCYGRIETIFTAPYAVFTSLGLSDDDVDALQRRHALTSRRGEAAWWQLTTNAAVVLAASSAPLALSRTQGTIARRLGLTAVSVAGVFLIGLALLRFTLFTTGFVD